MPVKFADYSREQLIQLGRIYERALKLRVGFPRKLDFEMDIMACAFHVPLDLDQLEAADDFNFAHDIAGIHNCLDRKTGKLTKCFLPRCARKTNVTAGAVK